MELQQIVERVADIRHSRPSAHVRQRVAEAAQELSRAGDMQAHLELATEALAAFSVLLYEADADGQPCNYDRVTARILVPVPWSDRGARKWKMRQWEGRVLRRIMLDRTKERRRKPPLFDYSELSNRWYLNVSDYPTAAAALEWIRGQGPRFAEWRTSYVEFHEQRARYTPR